MSKIDEYLDESSKDPVMRVALPLGAAAAVGGSLYGISRLPVWGTKKPFFKNLRRENGNHAWVVLPKDERGGNPLLNKIMSGFDKTYIEKTHGQEITHPHGGVGIDPRNIDFDMNTSQVINHSNADIHSGMNQATHEQDLGRSFAYLKSRFPDLFPTTYSFKPSSTREEIVDSMVDQFKKTGKNFVMKPNAEANYISAENIFTLDKLQDPKVKERLFKALDLPELKIKKELGIQDVYAQEYLPGMDTYRVSLIGDQVVPNATNRRFGIMNNLMDRISPVERRKRKNLETYLQNKLDTHRAAGREYGLMNRADNPMVQKNPKHYEQSNPDVLAKFDEAGNVVDAKIVDMNYGTGVNYLPSKSPFSSWAISRALTGKQPRIVAGTVGMAGAIPAGIVMNNKLKKDKES